MSTRFKCENIFDTMVLVCYICGCREALVNELVFSELDTLKSKVLHRVPYPFLCIDAINIKHYDVPSSFRHVKCRVRKICPRPIV